MSSKYEKQIKSGEQARDKYMLPNYFVSQKMRAKITKSEETEGNKVLLGDSKKPAKKGKGRGNSKNRGSDSDQEMFFEDQCPIRHKDQKSQYIQELVRSQLY